MTPPTDITRLFNETGGAQFLSAQAQASIAYFQDQAFFRLAVEKQARLARLAPAFAAPGKRKVFISHTLQNLRPDPQRFDVAYLPKGFFAFSGTDELAQRAALLEDAIALLNNNDVHDKGSAEGYTRVYHEAQNTLFAAWDFDNHHWMSLSPVLAAHSDVYVPAHRDNHYALSRYNHAITDAVSAGIIQWSSTFLAGCVQSLLDAKRADTPLGMHIPYGSFTYRNQVVATLAQKIPTVGFSSHQFHTRTEQDRLQEWASHKSHWIIPVLNDITIRIFDALVSGGIPIVPESLRWLHPVSSIPAEHILFYGAGDIMDPARLVEKANRIFDSGGPGKLVERHRYALTHHHGDCRVGQILSHIHERLQP